MIKPTKNTSSGKKRVNKEAFLARLKVKLPTIKVVSNYVNLTTKIVVRDELGILYKVMPNHLLEGNKPSIASAIDKTEAFRIKLKIVHPDLILIDDYINSYTDIKVKDKKDIIYTISPDKLMRMRPTIRSCKNKTDAYLKRLSSAHKNKYNYEKTEYISNNIKIIIICPIHGEFTQIPSEHLQGCGCPICSKEKMNWSYTQWGQKAANSNNFESFKVYLIKVFNDKECFYKIGKTYTKITSRFKPYTKNFPYNYEVISLFSGNCRSISSLEHYLHRKYSNLKYTPINPFKGDKECFKNISIKDFISASETFLKPE